MVKPPIGVWPGMETYLVLEGYKQQEYATINYASFGLGLRKPDHLKTREEQWPLVPEQEQKGIEHCVREWSGHNEDKEQKLETNG